MIRSYVNTEIEMHGRDVQRDWRILWRRVVDGLTYDELAFEVGVTRERARQLVARAARKLGQPYPRSKDPASIKQLADYMRTAEAEKVWKVANKYGHAGPFKLDVRTHNILCNLYGRDYTRDQVLAHFKTLGLDKYRRELEFTDNCGTKTQLRLLRVLTHEAKR